MAQQNERLEELQRRKAIAAAEKEALDAEFALSESRRKLAESLAGPNPELAAARSSKEIAEARKTQSEAELAAFKAQIGDMPSSGIAGSVELTDKAGSMETALLAAIALGTAGKRIAEQVAALLAELPPVRIVVMPAGEVPSFQGAMGFFSQKAVLQRAFVDAIRSAQSASRAAEKLAAAVRTEAVPLAAAGVALDAVTKLLGFFRSDFKAGGTELGGDNALLAETTGGELRARYPRTGTQILLKLAFNPAAVASVGANLLPQLDELSAQCKAAADSLASMEEGTIARLEAAKASAASEADKKTQDDLLRTARAAAARLTATIAAYDAFVDKLMSPDDKTLAMIRELDTWKSLQDSGTYLIVVKVNKAGGSHYVEKNLWTTFGAMPYKVMGGVIASYSLFEGASGDLVASGIVPIHGGFTKANKVANAIK